MRKYLAAQVGVLQWLEAEVRDDKPDAVHKARVATRRLRSALRTFRPLLNRTVTDPLRREVQWLTGLLGAPRDAEVLLRHFQGMADELEPELLVGSSVCSVFRRTWQPSMSAGTLGWSRHVTGRGTSG